MAHFFMLPVSVCFLEVFASEIVIGYGTFITLPMIQSTLICVSINNSTRFDTIYTHCTLY